MSQSLTLLLMKIVEVLFFTGLIGCACVVIISWISIFREGFSSAGDAKSELPRT
jgi:hypothetical protein